MLPGGMKAIAATGVCMSIFAYWQSPPGMNPKQPAIAVFRRNCSANTTVFLLSLVGSISSRISWCGAAVSQMGAQFAFERCSRGIRVLGSVRKIFAKKQDLDG
jgi:hypothetical protein